MHKRVGAYLQKALKGEETLAAAMDPRCRVTFMLPAYGEPILRILEVLESILRMQGADVLSEVICLVNNPEDDGTERERKARRMNTLLLELPVWRNADAFFGAHRFSREIIERAQNIREHLPVYVIDKSHLGKELHAGNVGRARNRVLAEAVLRYERAGREGLLVSTDADVQFTDAHYLKKLLALFDQEPELIAVSGGVDFVFDPDTQIPEERDRLRAAFDRFILERSWAEIERFLQGAESQMAPEHAFFGSHMIMRSRHAAAVGGFAPLAKHEDTQLGKLFCSSAVKNGFRVGNAKRLLRAQVALRESNRTAASFLPVLLRELDASKQVPHPQTGERVPLTHAVAEHACERLETSHTGRVLRREIGDLSRLLYKDVL